MLKIIVLFITLSCASLSCRADYVLFNTGGAERGHTVRWKVNLTEIKNSAPWDGVGRMPYDVDKLISVAKAYYRKLYPGIKTITLYRVSATCDLMSEERHEETKSRWLFVVSLYGFKPRFPMEEIVLLPDGTLGMRSDVVNK